MQTITATGECALNHPAVSPADAGPPLTAEQLVALYLPRVHRFAIMVSPWGTDPEDLAHQAMLRALERPERWEPGRGSFDAWLWRVVVNVARDAGRLSRRTELLSGRRLTVSTSAGHIYYRCRGRDAPDRCTQRGFGEQAILPWAGAVIAELDRLAPGSFEGEALAEGKTADTAPDALANVEESLRRADFMFYSAKRWSEEQYLAEVSRLTTIRDELAQAVGPKLPPLDFTGILDAWNTADPQTRRQLLGQLFDALDVEDAEVVSYLPRSDRAAEVAALMDHVLVAAEREVCGFTT